MSRRKNEKFRDDHKPNKPETVLIVNNNVEDDILNPKEEDKPSIDDGVQVQKLPEWMVDAINSGEKLQVTDDPNMMGKKTPDEEPAQEADPDDPDEPDPVDIPLKPEAEVNPIQASMDDLNAARIEKKVLFEQGKFQRESIAVERENFLHRKTSRSIPVPQLPSCNKTYPEGASISYFPYNVQDLEDMNNPEIPVYQKYLIALDGMRATGMTPLELTFGDFLFICDARQLQAMGDDVSFKYPFVCSSCNRSGVYSFKLSQVEFDELKAKLPVRIRLYSFPDEVFEFLPHTIGDVITLMRSDKYWRTIGNDFITDKNGNRLIDDMAINASRCISHPWEEAYVKFLEASENPKDRYIFDQLNILLYHGTKPIRFKCPIPLDKKLYADMAVEAANLVNGVTSGELSTITPNPENEEIPPWAQVHLGGSDKGKKIETCGAVNQIDVLVGDIIIPFCGNRDNLEYGVLGV